MRGLTKAAARGRNFLLDQRNKQMVTRNPASDPQAREASLAQFLRKQKMQTFLPLWANERLRADAQAYVDLINSPPNAWGAHVNMRGHDSAWLLGRMFSIYGEERVMNATNYLFQLHNYQFLHGNPSNFGDNK